MSPTTTPGALSPASTPAAAGGPTASAPASATTPCCWCDKFEKNVAEHGRIWALSTQHPNDERSFKLFVDLAANEVVVTTTFQWGAVAPAVTAAERTAIQDGLTATTARAWSGKYKLKVVDPACSPNTKTLSIRFVLAFVASGADITVKLKPGPGTSSVGRGVMNLDTLDTEESAFTLIHEYGHTLGLPDEYLVGGVSAATIGYKRANGSTSTVTLPQPTNLMGGRTIAFVPRYFYFIEIEAQKLLRSGAGLGRAGITCEIV